MTVESPRPAISLLALGRVTTDGTEHLVRRVGAIEQIDLRLERDTALHASSGEINRAMDAASCDWVLLLRAHESISEPLADEIARSIGPSPVAWGFRLRTQPMYCGRPLNLEPPAEGELRLIHRRHARFVAGAEAKIQGPVVRSSAALEVNSFSSRTEHEEWLAARGTRRGAFGRLGVFVVDVLRCRPFRAGLNGLRYVWVNAGWRRVDVH